MRGKTFLLSLLCLGLFLFACGREPAETEDPAETEEGFAVSVEIDAGRVCGVQLDYCLSRRLMGGQLVSAAPGPAEPLGREEVVLLFSRRDLGEDVSLAEETFGAFFSVILEDGEKVPLPSLWEWSPVWGGRYRFTLSGAGEEGFYLTAEEGETDYAVTSWADLPVELLP